MSNWGQTEQIRELRTALEEIFKLAERDAAWSYKARTKIRTIARETLDKDNPTVRE
jgi:hypothetical protein